MKPRFLLFILISACSCTMADKNSVVNEASDKTLLSIGYSKSQIWINDLKRKYIHEYAAVQNDALKDVVKKKYRQKLHNYLMDSCLKIIECGNVYLKNLKKDISIGSDQITGQFNDTSSSYIFSNSYANDEDLNNFPEYKYLNTLKEGQRTSVKFLYSGDCLINNPEENEAKIFIIKATPYIE